MAWMPLQHISSVEPDVWPHYRESKWSTAFVRDVQFTLNMEARDDWREALLFFLSLSLSPLSQPPSQCMHIPQPHACVLQTAVKQSRLECVTACNTALGHARCLLPLRSECKEIINRFEFRAEQRGNRNQIVPQRERGNFSLENFNVALKVLNTS